MKKEKKNYSINTKRHKTQFPGVYEREAERTLGIKDICYDISYKSNDGKKVWEKIGWKGHGYSGELARKIRNERIITLQHGEELPAEKKVAPCMRDIWEKYKDWAMTNKTRAGRDDIYQYNKHIKEKFEDKRLNDISSFDLERLKADLTKDGLSPASVKHCLILIRQIFNKAITWGLYQGMNPVKGVKMPTIQNQRTRFLSHTEADRLLDYLKKPKPRQKKDGTSVKVKKTSPYLHDISLLSLHTGMRASEIFALRGQDIDFGNAIITVRDTKNTNTRHAYMTEAVKELLTQRTTSLDALLFPDRNGDQAQAVSQYFRKAINALEFNNGVRDPRERVYFHTLRHTFASWLALQGETLLTIKELLGHKSMTMTERYSHLIPDHKRRATLALEKRFETSMNGEELIK